MKKIKLLLLSLLCVVIVSGCGKDNGSSYQTSSSNSSIMETSNSISSIVVEQPKLLSMSNYFTGMKVSYEKANFVDSNGTTITFEEVIDRQLEVLSQDLIYRLTYIYGASGNTQSNIVSNRSSNDTKNFDYFYNNIQANSKNINMITDLNETFDSIKDVDLKNKEETIKAFQKSILLSNENNVFWSNTRLNIIGAMGGFYSNVKYETGEYIFEKDTSNAWNMSCDDSTFDNVNTKYKDEIKLGIAKLLGVNTNETMYNKQLLSNIDFFDTNTLKEELTNYVLNNVIGSELVEKDDEYYNIWIDKYNGLINTESCTSINLSTNLEDKAPRLYKGYSIVIPAIVEQALSNTFENTEVSLYPLVNRKGVNVQSTYNTNINDKNTEIVLMPKVNTKLTKLVFDIIGTKSETITLTYDVVINGTKTSNTKQISLNTTKQTIELELNGTLGAYNGNTTSYTNNNIFNNADQLDNNGDNYIMFHLKDNSFNITFNGMYDK